MSTSTPVIVGYIVRQLDDEGYDWDILARSAAGEILHSDDRWPTAAEALSAMQAGAYWSWFPECKSSPEAHDNHDWIAINQGSKQ